MSRLFSCSTQVIDALNKQLKIAFLIEIDFQEFKIEFSRVDMAFPFSIFIGENVNINFVAVIYLSFCHHLMSTPFSFFQFDWGRHEQINHFNLRS